MISSRPYLIRAIYQWLVDNQLTPYIMVDATDKMTQVPEQYVEDGKIVLNIEPQAVNHLNLGNETVEFYARFSGVSHHIFVPTRAVKAIYAFENGRGMIFNEEDDDPPPEPIKSTDKRNQKPNLKIVK